MRIVLGLVLILVLSPFVFAEISTEEEALLIEDGNLQQQIMQTQQRQQLMVERRIEIRGILKYLQQIKAEEEAKAREEAETKEAEEAEVEKVD